MYWVSVIDLYRRLALSSFLLVMHKGHQLVFALVVGAASIVIYREIGP